MTNVLKEAADERWECLAIWDEHQSLFPVLGNLCPRCAGARRTAEGICGLCRSLDERHRNALDRLYVLGMANEESLAYRWVADWKDDPSKRGAACCVDIVLSLWWEQHGATVQSELEEPILTSVGTEHRVLAHAVQACHAVGWPAPTLSEIVDKAPGVVPQRLCGRDVRLGKRPEDWVLRRDVAGRDLVLFDDVYVTGASMHSLAHALKSAGARRVHGVAFLRHLTGSVYFEELIRRRVRCARLGMSLLWAPDQLWYGDRHSTGGA